MNLATSTGTPAAGSEWPVVKLQFGAADARILEDQRVYDGHFKMHRLTVQHRLFGGGWSEPLSREIFERGDAVGVLPWDPVSDDLIMLEQYRVGVRRDEDSPWMLELVAGVVEDGESDAEVARREAQEEAALSISELEPVARYYPSAGACTEQVRLFIGRTQRPEQGGVYGNADEGEDIRVHILPRAEVMDYLTSGFINNGHTLIALQWLALHGDELRGRWT